ncbi:MAG: orotidine-5'-phosphate decarboxylase [Thermodesulfovibrionales bacterium]|nr:orotidine-5'-phosphate decarboxylase [Thermodesulfovibrionales bacterium]
MLESKGIIFAADIEQKKQLFDVIKQVAPYIEAIKIGNLVLYEFGWNILKELKTYTNKPLIVDLKLMDIPYISEKLSRKALENGADGMIICGPVGDETISTCKAIFKSKMIFLFTEFTHPSGLITDEMADEYIELALTLNCDGIQVPGTKHERISAIKKKVNNRLIIISCGIGIQGPQIGSAIAAGADYEIIGRSIYSPNELGTTPGEAAMTAHKMISVGLRKYDHQLASSK